MSDKSRYTIGSPISLTFEQNFTCPSDGYIQAEVSDIDGAVRVDCLPLNGIVQAIGIYQRQTAKVNKGMVLYYGETVNRGSAKFYPLIRA